MKNALTPKASSHLHLFKKEFRNRLEGALLPSRGIAALLREQVFGKGPRACEGGGVQPPEGRGTRVLNEEPKGAAPAPKRWPNERAKGNMQIDTTRASSLEDTDPPRSLKWNRENNPQV